MRPVFCLDQNELLENDVCRSLSNGWACCSRRMGHFYRLLRQKGKVRGCTEKVWMQDVRWKRPQRMQQRRR
jgi:hypothetical protein